MNNIKILIFLLIFISCARDVSHYEEFQRKPDYLINASGKLKSYYNAYDSTMQLWEIPHESLYVPTNYGTAHVIVTGDSENAPLVLLHGMNASSVMWYPNIKALSNSYHVFSIDLIVEPGKSEPGIEIGDVDVLVNWYFEIFDSLNLNEINLLGASRGGWLAVKIALDEREKIKKLILLSPAQTFMWIPPSTDIASSLLYEISPSRERLDDVLEVMTTDINNIHPHYRELYYQAIKRSEISKSVFDMKPFAENELNRLNMPVFVVIGDEDFINNQKSIKKAENSLRDVKTMILEDAGHFLSFDKPTVVNNEIIKFLNK